MVSGGFPGEHSAGSHYILPSGGPDCGRYTGGIEHIAELLHFLLRTGAQRRTFEAVEAYEVNTAIKPFKSVYQLLTVAGRIVHPTEHYVFKRQTALMSEIIAP